MQLLIIFLPGIRIIDFALPGTLKVIVYPATWLEILDAPQPEKKLNISLFSRIAVL